ncbi:MAG: hypothetical protein HZB12_00290 [Candidatus Yonathbacteria bacterium]|nr:hypothetical protein [Candidatus Yonathbacteria bacterium]
MFKNFNRTVLSFGSVVLIGVALYLNQQKNISEAPIGYSWYKDDLGYRILLPDGWRAEKDPNAADGTVVFWPDKNSPYLSMLEFSTTFTQILKDSRKRELLLQVAEESRLNSYPDSIRTETTIAGKAAICYIHQTIPKNLQCFIFVNDKDTFDISSDFLVIPEVQKMWDSLEFNS